ncbi:PadR family transcriptional regulator [Streptomonospora nanhaiensis]|uniref:PadR family transcriptional regulator n=1 Tax=Streptomonospora nanhaiensis TaxID=1323731 RepID=UPI001C395160|nr:PadR family transcriptional regulator [Streptomonospora nanhaiensis]MBV2364072.1 PadR family transcriptional regulator [Streptomonospora nanhaiensis]MBX9387944.1 PadR family transcriptional regulator [Streptomonospora nanhaiensis]
MGGRRARVLELAVLGHLAGAPMHGYELRKRLNSELGAFHAFSYGSLYPCLKEMVREGLVVSSHCGGAGGRRSRIVYRLTDSGRDRLGDLLAESTPAATDDECFGVHFTLFGRTRTEVRLRILDGRRARLQERLADLRELLADPRQDPYTVELHRHRAEALESEVGWLDDLIRRERRCAEHAPAADATISGNAPLREGGPPPTGSRH